MTRIYTPDDLELFASLIAKIGVARDGSSDMDLEIAISLYPQWKFRVEPSVPFLLIGARIMVTTESGTDEHIKIPNYTTSIDAALTLVPDNWYVHDLSSSPKGREWWGVLFQDQPPWGKEYGPACNEVGSPTPALALCIAALKARKAT